MYRRAYVSNFEGKKREGNAIGRDDGAQDKTTTGLHLCLANGVCCDIYVVFEYMTCSQCAM